MSRSAATALAVLLVVSVVAYLLACSQAAWSPDGEQVAFVSCVGEEGERRLYVAPASGKSSRMLWRSRWYLGPPGWSPGGKHLAVVQVSPLSDVAAEDAADWPRSDEGTEKTRVPLVARLTRVDARSGDRGLVAEWKFLGDPDLATDVREKPEPQPQWAGDGKLLVWPSVSLRQVRVLDASDGRLVKRFENVVLAKVSPSGKQVAFVEGGTGDSGEAPPMLAVVTVDGMKRREVLRLGSCAWNVAWSRDGSRVLVAGTPAETGEEDEAAKPEEKETKNGFWAVTVSDGKCRFVAPAPDGFGQPIWVDWSPDGKTIAVAAETESEEGGGGKGFGIWLLGTDGSKPERVDSPSEDAQAYHPVFSPDGSKLAYRLIRKDQKVVWLVVYDVASGERTLVPLDLPAEVRERDKEAGAAESEPEPPAERSEGEQE